MGPQVLQNDRSVKARRPADVAEVKAEVKAEAKAAAKAVDVEVDKAEVDKVADKVAARAEPRPARTRSRVVLAMKAACSRA
jgi:hypothetical protein